ncbi:hypothetical protein BH23BAC4_BH23BAC4_09710 [soil metagenome]
MATVGTADSQALLPNMDAFYQGESARRAFYNGFAISGEVAYRPVGMFMEQGSAAPGRFGLNARVDYALFRQTDASVIFDLSGGLGGGPMRLSWLAVTPRWHHSRTDYAIRVAVDPASEGGLGFRQTDVGFLSSTSLGMHLSTEATLGLRRVRAGYDQALLSGDLVSRVDGTMAAPMSELNNVTFTGGETRRTRVVGREVHASWGYTYLLDPAGSGIQVLVQGLAGGYTLVEARTPTPSDETPEPRIAADEPVARENQARIGTGWLRAGLDYHRPTYVVSPSVSMPLVSWQQIGGDTEAHGPRFDRLRFGVRVMMR